MAKSLSISSSERLATLAEAFRALRPGLTGVCAFLLVFPVVTFDRWDPPLWVGVEVLVLAGAWGWHREDRPTLAAVVAVGLLFFAAGELYFRLSVFGWEGLHFRRCLPADYRHPLAALARDETSYSGLAPGRQGWLKGRVFTVNDQGFRGASFARTRPEGVYRVVVLGSSATMGSGVGDDERFSVHLERKLAAGLGREVEVVNLALGASRFTHMVHALEHVGRSLEPDLVLMVANRSRVHEGPWRPQRNHVGTGGASRASFLLDRRLRWFSSQFFFARLLARARRGGLPRALRVSSRHAGTARHDDPLPPEAPVPTGALTEALSALRAQCGSARAAVFLLKPLRWLDEPRHDAAYRAAVAAVAASNGVAVIDTYRDDYRHDRPRDLVCWPGDGHPNAAAHRKYADYMARELLNLLRSGGD